MFCPLLLSSFPRVLKCQTLCCCTSALSEREVHKRPLRAPSIELPWDLPGNGLDLSPLWIGLVQTHARTPATSAQITIELAAYIWVHLAQATATHSTLAWHKAACLETRCRDLDSWIKGVMYRQQLQGWGKTRRGGDITLMDIRTFVRHLSAYFRSERWVSSNPYFEGGTALSWWKMWKSDRSPTVSSAFPIICDWTLKKKRDKN